MLTKRLAVLLFITCSTVAISAAADETCLERRKFTIDKNTTSNVLLGSAMSPYLVGSGEKNITIDYRFILQGASEKNDLSCDFDVSYQAVCSTKNWNEEIVLSPWKKGQTYHDGGNNQCVLDSKIEFKNVDGMKVPEECNGRVTLRTRYEAKVTNKGRLQVVDVYSGSMGCGIP